MKLAKENAGKYLKRSKFSFFWSRSFCGSWELSRYVKFFGQQNWPRHLKTLPVGCWPYFTQWPRHPAVYYYCKRLPSTRFQNSWPEMKGSINCWVAENTVLICGPLIFPRGAPRQPVAERESPNKSGKLQKVIQVAFHLRRIIEAYFVVAKWLNVGLLKIAGRKQPTL